VNIVMKPAGTANIVMNTSAPANRLIATFCAVLRLTEIATWRGEESAAK
jgi:hypothetical protein